MDNSDAQIRPDGDAERELARLLVSTSGTVPRPWPRCGGEDSAQHRSAGRLRIGDFDQPVEDNLPLADAPRQRRVSAAEVEHAPRGERLGLYVDPASSADDPSAARGGAIREGEQADVRWLDR